LGTIDQKKQKRGGEDWKRGREDWVRKNQKETAARSKKKSRIQVMGVREK